MPDEKLARSIRSRSRRTMLQMLVKRKRMSVHEISERMKISESLASRHLKLLYDLGLIDFRFIPPEKFYFIKIKSAAKLLRAYETVVMELKD